MARANGQRLRDLAWPALMAVPLLRWRERVGMSHAALAAVGHFAVFAHPLRYASYLTRGSAGRRWCTNDREAPVNIAYVLTDYLRLAMTFISGEIDAVKQGGNRVFPIAMNAPASGDLTTPEGRARRDRTLYLKAAPLRVATATAAEFLAHPVAMAKLATSAVRSAGVDLNQGMRRMVHLAYAAHVARYCRRNGIRHIHAHFVAPATIAWFATDILNFGGDRRARWSFTLHGPHDLFDEKIARMDLKAASASFVACISDFARSQLYRMAAPVYWDRFHVVRCGIDLAAFPQRTP